MADPFVVPESFVDSYGARLLGGLVRPALGSVLALGRLNRLYAELASRADARPFAERALEALGVGWMASEPDLARIPRGGPLVVVANHPFGGLDGLILMALLRRVRPDIRLLGNHLLRAVPDLRDELICVDPFGGPGAARRNAAGLRRALRWVRSGGALGIFPAGEVSHARLRPWQVSDGPWGAAVGRLIHAAGAPVTTLLIEGRNSLLFQAMGLLHPGLRTLMLPRELLKHRGRTVRVRVGGPIATSRLEAIEDPADLASYLKLRTHILRGVSGGGSIEDRRRSVVPALPPVVEAVQPEALAGEASRLPAEQLLLSSGPFDVFYARAGQAPCLLREIGRLREIAFRLVGEGTGRTIDLDRFDDHYLHLFIWNRRTEEVVGAYRMGPTDEILPKLGLEGLYTSTLFRFRRPLLVQIGPALEMGRSFIRPEYQRTPSALALLWKGIGRYVARHPRYRRLFGPVSISNEYQSMSRHLLMAFLKANRYMTELARLIRPRNRPRFEPVSGWDPSAAGAAVRSLDDVDDLVREIESDRRSMPILLRQYLRLNGVLLGFNVDAEFGGVLDGLILVDLARVDRPLLARYMGPENVEPFLSHHSVPGGP